ncbi:3-hydroxyacyl-ACP dehydratase FabZ family protein [Desulfotalea psychrophila]|uniref:Related to (3R)-hydroxymyristoyl-[acyl carrier protein] dehydratase n=1 Tax=Desulfotalea psychrophila (strain LSv54 / DSM 12343) TaxID=177439 RepID=Q6AKI8_DESPS|nr:3-hydroxyacyl-ACP dehydratase FabZ family protein [Desulfotalea psychrophila]CAG37137.1 related to (3R)-hydroxymyristoyl-[acyl carrier protein] dehydratase [Desulfotalea psychrophila LSv54]
MDELDRIKSLIPHREPFLQVDRIIGFDRQELCINTEKTFAADLDIFKGHYPDNPIVPGVILCEAIFQSGALLMALLGQEKQGEQENAVPVLTRIGGARFKRFAGPGDTVQIEVRVQETVGSATFFKGRLKVGGKTAVQIEFSCAMIDK